MRLFSKVKDGGKESTVDAFFLFEIKWLGSIALLRFNKGSRTNYHSHAFNALTWFIKGDMTEHDINGDTLEYKSSLLPKLTKKDKFHKVVAEKTSWCFTIRGRWDNSWKEFNPTTEEYLTLTHGRDIINTSTTND